MENTRQKKYNLLKKSYPFFVIFATLFMAIGYAVVNSVSLDITGTATAELADGIVITEVDYDSSGWMDDTESEIIRAYQTMLESQVLLGVNKESFITYKITIHNAKDKTYAFDKVDYLLGADTYSNTNIVFGLQGVKRGDILEPGKSVTFTITFCYKDGYVPSEKTELKSMLIFKYEYVTSPVLAPNMIPVIYDEEKDAWTKVEPAAPEWHDYLNVKWANAVTYHHGLVYNAVENDKDVKKFNGTNQDYVSIEWNSNQKESINYDFRAKASTKDTTYINTVVARFKINEYGDGKNPEVIIGNVQAGGFYIGISKYNEIIFRFYEPTNTTEKRTAVTLQATTPLELDTWYTVVATYDGTVVKLYINGTMEASMEFTNEFVRSQAPIVVGGNPDVNGNVTGDNFKGVISEVAIIRDCLSEDEIAKNYGKVIYHIPTKHNVISYLKFDADHGMIANSAQYEFDGLALDGVDDYVSVGYSSYDFQDSFTIGVRVKLNAYSDKEYTFFGNPQEAGFNLFKSTQNKFTVSVYNVNTSAYVSAEMSEQPSLNTWYTVIATFDGAKLCLYVDGVLQDSVATDLNMKVCTTPFMISVNANLKSSLGGGYLNGKISDAFLVDEALTDNQIRTYYANDVTAVVSDKTLISYNFRSYEFRENNTVIPDEMINSMWVWVPRFKAVTPIENTAIDVSLVELNEPSHDSFNFGGTELEGFWTGKFENGSEISTANVSANGNLLIKPNCASIRNRTLSTMFYSVQAMLDESNMYGFTLGTRLLDSHVVKSNEWGAIAYFTYSRYGLWNTGNYQMMAENTTEFITGGADYMLNVNQSSTQNIYGIYDLYGGVNEWTMGRYYEPAEGYDKSEFNPLPNSKYYVTYMDEATYNSNHLQHAMLETQILNDTRYDYFVGPERTWVIRKNLFGYSFNPGTAEIARGTRTVLVIK